MLGRNPSSTVKHSLLPRPRPMWQKAVELGLFVDTQRLLLAMPQQSGVPMASGVRTTDLRFKHPRYHRLAKNPLRIRVEKCTRRNAVELAHLWSKH